VLPPKSWWDANATAASQKSNPHCNETKRFRGVIASHQEESRGPGRLRGCIRAESGWLVRGVGRRRECRIFVKREVSFVAFLTLARQEFERSASRPLVPVHRARLAESRGCRNGGDAGVSLCAGQAWRLRRAKARSSCDAARSRREVRARVGRVRVPRDRSRLCTGAGAPEWAQGRG
jgi:hypothetical protein